MFVDFFGSNSQFLWLLLFLFLTPPLSALSSSPFDFSSALFNSKIFVNSFWKIELDSLKLWLHLLLKIGDTPTFFMKSLIQNCVFWTVSNSMTFQLRSMHFPIPQKNSITQDIYFYSIYERENVKYQMAIN